MDEKDDAPARANPNRKRRDLFYDRIKKAVAPILAALSIAASLTACGGADGGATVSPTAAAALIPTATASPTANALAPSPTSTASPTATALAPSPTAATSPTATALAPSPTTTAALIPTAAASPSPTAIGAPSPTATAALAPSPTAAPAPEFDAFAFLRRLTEEYSPRESGTDAELRAARFLRGELDGMGYDAEIRAFSFERLVEETTFSIDGAPPEPVVSYRMGLSGIGAAEGALADAGTGFADDIPPDGFLAGKIALIERGTITFEEKVHRAADAGAVGVIVFNNLPGAFGGTLSTIADIPAVSIDREAGLRMRRAIAAGNARASVSVTSVAERSRNVIARLPSGGADAADGDGATVIIGAHYDTVADTRGANDNASGVAALMAVAARVRERAYPFEIRFILFGAEETGLFGSRHYAQEMSAGEIADTVAMLNLDVVGSGDGFEARGDLYLARDAAEIAKELGAPMFVTSDLTSVLSDHVPFSERGIPALFLMANDLSRINSPQDEIRHVDPALPSTAAEITVRLLERLAERA